MRELLEAFDIDVLHLEYAATVDIPDPDVARELRRREDVDITRERGSIYVIKGSE